MLRKDQTKPKGFYLFYYWLFAQKARFIMSEYLSIYLSLSITDTECRLTLIDSIENTKK